MMTCAFSVTSYFYNALYYVQLKVENNKIWIFNTIQKETSAFLDTSFQNRIELTIWTIRFGYWTINSDPKPNTVLIIIVRHLSECQTSLNQRHRVKSHKNYNLNNIETINRNRPMAVTLGCTCPLGHKVHQQWSSPNSWNVHKKWFLQIECFPTVTPHH